MATTEDTTSTGLIHVPKSAEEMLPPKQSSLITEAANFLRAHWNEVKPYYEAISGEADSMHGSVTLDEAACVFKIKEMAEHNGFAFLSSIPTVKLRLALRYGYKRNTGTAIKLLEAQYRRVHRIEHRKED